MNFLSKFHDLPLYFFVLGGKSSREIVALMKKEEDRTQVLTR